MEFRIETCLLNIFLLSSSFFVLEENSTRFPRFNNFLQKGKNFLETSFPWTRCFPSLYRTHPVQNFYTYLGESSA